MLTPTTDHLAQRHAGWALPALSPLGPQKLEVLGDGAAAGPSRTGPGGGGCPQLTSPVRCVGWRGKQPDHQQRLSLA